MASSSWPIIKSNRKKNIESNNDKLSPPTASAVDSRYLRLLPEVEPYLHDENSDNFSYADLECLPDFLLERSEEILDLRLEYNSFKEIPPEVNPTIKNQFDLQVVSFLLIFNRSDRLRTWFTSILATTEYLILPRK